MTDPAGQYPPKVARRFVRRHIREGGYCPDDSIERRIAFAIECPSAGAFADRPPTFGDAEQARILAAMNANVPYCDRCFAECAGGTVHDIGQWCDETLGCKGIWVPGAGMTQAWLRYAEIETEGE